MTPRGPSPSTLSADGPKSEADFEVEPQEFCRFARLGFSILQQIEIAAS